MKKVLYVIIGLLVVYLILCLVGPKESVITRSILINSDQEKVMATLGDFKFFTEKWSPWTEKDPQMKMTFEGEPGKVGHKYSWEGNDQVGKGNQEFVSITNDSIYQKLNLITWHVEADVYLVTKPENNSTNVSWTFVMKNGFIWRGMSLFMSMEKQMAPDFEHGLDKLKKAIESMPTAPATVNYEVKEITWEEKTFFGKRGTFAFDKVSSFFGDNWHKVMEELKKNNAEPTMAPCGIYYKWDEAKGETDVVAALCAPKETKIKGWEVIAVPTSRVLQIEYYGSPGKSINAHLAMDEYIKANNLPAQSLVIEEYVTDPGLEKDTAKWLTNIYYVLPVLK